MNSLAALLVPPILLVPLMGILGLSRQESPLAAELRRKALHVAVGLAALSFPWLFAEPWLIVAALASVVAWMTAVRQVAPLRKRFGGCLHDTKRKTLGEIYFAVAVALLLFAAGEQTLYYVVPLLILTLADAAAAIVGAFSPLRFLGRMAAQKTLGGSLAFFSVAYLVTLVALVVADVSTPAHMIVIAACVAAVTCVTEAVSHRGSDNLSVPLSAYGTLVAFGV